MMAFLHATLFGVPVWALAVMVNLAAAVGLLVALFGDCDLRARTTWRRVALVLGIVCVAAVGGAPIAWIYGLVYWFEALAWRSLTAQRTGARRIH